MHRSTSTCASCKHQRKKCTDKCTLAPHFPVDKSREFRAVHKIFGVSNITKLIVGLREEDQRRAVESLVWEAMCWQKDPRLGPYGEYQRVLEELRRYKSNYSHVHHQLVLNQSLMINHGMSNDVDGMKDNNLFVDENSPFYPYNYPHQHVQDGRIERTEKEIPIMMVPQVQPYIFNAFSHQL